MSDGKDSLEARSTQKAVASGLATVDAVFRNTEKYGSLHDAYFRFCQSDLLLAAEERQAVVSGI